MTIAERQNARPQLERLGAQRYLYSKAKSIFRWQAVLSGPVSAMAALVAVRFPQYAGYAALWGILVLIADVLWLQPWRVQLSEQAARIQEAFDCGVLNLRWNWIKLGKEQPSPETVKQHWDSYQPMREHMGPIEDWYPPSVDRLPLPLGRLACQRSNVVWDVNLRAQYASWTTGVLVAVVVLTILYGLYEELGLEDMLVALLPLAPFILLGIQHVLAQRQAVERLRHLEENIREAWNAALAGQPDEQITAVSRALQDEIYEYRRSNPLVFNLVYNLLRKKQQDQMYYGVEEMIAEAKHRMSSSQKAGKAANKKQVEKTEGET